MRDVHLDYETDSFADDFCRHPVDSYRDGLHPDESVWMKSRSCLQAMVSEGPRGEPCPRRN